jgi:hypothetical protein
MKLAILGADDESVELARWAVLHGQHQLVAAYDSAPYAAQLQQLSPNLRLNESWEALILADAADAVIVGRGGREVALAENIDPAERRADQLRKLVQAEVPLIVVCPACEAIVGYEIEMIRRDVGAAIVPYIPGIGQAAVGEAEDLIAWTENGPLGQIEQITLERQQADRSRTAVLERLARDVALLRRLIGTIQSVSATGPPAAIGRDPMGPKVKELPSLANLSVYFSGAEGLTARWSIVPAISGDQARLTIVGQRGNAILDMPTADDWLLTVNAEMESPEPRPRSHEFEQLFWQLTHGAVGDELADDTAWLSACRDQEAAEAVDRSLARGRTIELFNESHTEEQSFKGVMAMYGCLLLMGALAILFFVVLVESLQLPIRELLIWKLWPVYLLVLIVVFLLMQFFQLAVKREK